MKGDKHTGVSQFLLLGLSNDSELQPFLFGLFLSMYLVVVGNLLIILAVSSDSHLHKPMYSFLSNLSFVDICFTSTTVPKMLMNILAHNKDITYTECLTQAYFLMIFVGMHNFLLTVMDYNHFVAICHPLKYMIIMTPCLCVLLVLRSWIIIFCFFLLHILLLIQLTFSIVTEIPHFFCELTLLIKVATFDTLFNVNIILLYVSSILFIVFPITGILFSYSQIISSIVRMSSSASRYKAFSTCGSHFCAVSLLYGTALGVYLSLAVTHSSHESSVTSVMYTVVMLMVNPVIYSLRKKDVKGALRSFLTKAASGP
ncbi:Olfactory receptor 7D4 [Heterocephalus glaber]|uniref:Olfactory receptor 7D4 n=1 Tax=Heterocephalus glaber TaxID=10181 RepID=G5C869_HETGA|nr:olfactory receptor 7D4 [Heterocephalus glaber]EHB17730.1 Olfactory receptor 7D4 [Heterocephalus glaber]